MIRLTHYQRRSDRVLQNSVERLNEDVREHLSSNILVKICINRFFSRGLFGRIYDIVRAHYYQSDVNHVTGDVHFLTYLLDRRRTVLTILDCVLLERLHGIRRALIWLFWYWLPEKRCVAITVISEATRQQVLRHLRCDPDKVRVIYCNVSEEFKPVPRPFNVKRPRLLQIGAGPNKNVEGIAAALEGLNCDLVIIGPLSPAQIDLLKQCRTNYINYVNLSREALLEQYHCCDMVVFASTYEGFGLPIVEANAVGRPVVTSNIWSMPEVAGEAACLVDPFHVPSIRAGISRVIEDAIYREFLVERGFENVKRFKIENIAHQYEELYRDIHAKLKAV